MNKLSILFTLALLGASVLAEFDNSVNNCADPANKCMVCEADSGDGATCENCYNSDKDGRDCTPLTDKFCYYSDGGECDSCLPPKGLYNGDCIDIPSSYTSGTEYPKGYEFFTNDGTTWNFAKCSATHYGTDCANPVGSDEGVDVVTGCLAYMKVATFRCDICGPGKTLLTGGSGMCIDQTGPLVGCLKTSTNTQCNDGCDAVNHYYATSPNTCALHAPPAPTGDPEGESFAKIISTITMAALMVTLF